MEIRKNSVAFCGADWGDEGKGKIVDQIVKLAKICLKIEKHY